MGSGSARAGHPRFVPDATTVSDARFGARALFAGIALALVAVPFGLTIFLVEDRWAPLSRVDGGARDDLHAVALHHEGLVTALKVLSTIGSAVVYFPLFVAVAAWLAWGRLPRRAPVAGVTGAGSGPPKRGRKDDRAPCATGRRRPRRARGRHELPERSRAVRHRGLVRAAARLPARTARRMARARGARRGHDGAGDRLRARHARRPLRLRRAGRLRPRRRLGGRHDRGLQHLAQRNRKAARGPRAGPRTTPRATAQR